MTGGAGCTAVSARKPVPVHGDATKKSVFFGKDSYLLDSHKEESPSIEIVLGEQRAYFYRGRHLTGVSVLSTGREGYDTPTGHFHIIQMDEDTIRRQKIAFSSAV